MGDRTYLRRDYRSALEGFEQAVALSPNFCDWRHAAVLTYDGQLKKAIGVVREYMLRDPHFPAMAVGGWASHSICKADLVYFPAQN